MEVAISVPRKESLGPRRGIVPAQVVDRRLCLEVPWFFRLQSSFETWIFVVVLTCNSKVDGKKKRIYIYIYNMTGLHVDPLQSFPTTTKLVKKPGVPTTCHGPAGGCGKRGQSVWLRSVAWWHLRGVMFNTAAPWKSKTLGILDYKSLL